MARLRDAMAPGRYLVISHADVSPAVFFGDLTLVEPGLTDIWAWRPDSATVDTTSEFMRILGGVALKD
jgi:hypothetical protein